MVRRRTVLVDVDALTLALLGDAQGLGGPDGEHQHHGDAECCGGHDEVAPHLGEQLLRTATPEQALGDAEADGEQAERPCAPDAAEAVDGDSADRVVDSEPLDQVDGQDDDDPADGNDASPLAPLREVGLFSWSEGGERL
jgi:hypothetical protein